MIVRKLTAAVIASTVMTSGAWAQTSQLTADTDVTLTIDPAFEVYSDDILFSNGADNGATATTSDGLCTWTNTSDYKVVVESINSWELQGSGNASGETIEYQLAVANNTIDRTQSSTSLLSTDPASGLSASANRCSVTPTYVALSATLVEATGSKTAGDYSDEVTFTISAI
jgi:hypothetical protein